MSRLSFLTMLLVALVGFSATSRGQDAVAVSPEIYNILFENEDIRVLDILISPGERDEPHSHTRYMIFVREGGTLRVHPKAGDAYEATLERGQTQILEPVEQHWAENVGETVIRLVTVEFKL